jgi:putative transcriptional regulator
MDLTDHFLISMPAMADPNFAGTVVYLCEHTSQGALGLVINRPTELTVADLLERVELSLETDDPRRFAHTNVYLGGPVHPDHGFVLHEPQIKFNSSLQIGPRRTLTTSRDVLESMARGEGPQRSLVALGYAGWDAGQLEQEVAHNAWLTVAADARILFDTAPHERFGEAVQLLGIDLSRLAATAGHA